MDQILNLNYKTQEETTYCDFDLQEINKKIFVKNYSAAYLELNNLLAKDPTNYLAHIRRIELASKLSNLDKISKECSVNKKIKNLVLTSEIVQCFVKLQEEDNSTTVILKKFYDLLKKVGDEAVIFYGIGICLQSENQMSRAIKNFEKSISIDPDWYLSYFNLSQIYYHREDTLQGDTCFYLYERYAPYNIYGNFETHRNLSYELLEQRNFEDAENAISTLSEWWVENKGICPNEIKIYELFLLSRILSERGMESESQFKRNQALVVSHQLLNDDSLEEGIYYFLAKTLEENSEPDLANRFYEKIVTSPNLSQKMLDKICKQFVSEGNNSIFLKLIEKCYNSHPEKSTVRLYRVISKLKDQKKDIQEYLNLKEEVKDLLATSSQRVPIFSLLNKLVHTFDEDPEILGYLADLYAAMPHMSQAHKFYNKMILVDPKSIYTKIKYGKFLLKFDQSEEAEKLVATLESHSQDPMSAEISKEWNGFLAEYYIKSKNPQKCLNNIEKIYNEDPWNIVFLTIKRQSLELLHAKYEEINGSSSKSSLGVPKEMENEDWHKFDQETAKWQENNSFEIVYLREKFRFLYKNKEPESYCRIESAAKHFNSEAAVTDFIRLLNTNYHHLRIYSLLGRLTKDSGQFEVSKMWYEALLKEVQDDLELRSECFVEIADCLIWKNQQIDKAVEYLKIALDLKEIQKSTIYIKIAHAYLKKGDIEGAQLLLEEFEHKNHIEYRFLRGLIFYRNGNLQNAKEIWKPLLSLRSDSLLSHNIKREILKYYFDQEPYSNTHLV